MLTVPQRDTVAPMRWAYIGNFGPEHSTENHVARALRTIGETVTPFQENEASSWTTLGAELLAGFHDVIIWTKTNWPEGPDVAKQERIMALAKRRGVLVVGYHLDRWWGLKRQSEIGTLPYFRLVDVLCTADGGHDELWNGAGIDHVWFPPAISRAEAELVGTPRRRFDADVAFVGSWQPGYHDEWGYRYEMLEHVEHWYGDRFVRFPFRGQHAVRGQALADLYASVRVVVGDSCLAGAATHYWSDRIPETLGRGAFLIHPSVEGLSDHFDADELITYTLGDWDGLHDAIDFWLDRDRARANVAVAGKERVLAEHTYEDRMARLRALITARTA